MASAISRIGRCGGSGCWSITPCVPRSSMQRPVSWREPLRACSTSGRCSTETSIPTRCAGPNQIADVGQARFVLPDENDRELGMNTNLAQRTRTCDEFRPQIGGEASPVENRGRHPVAVSSVEGTAPTAYTHAALRSCGSWRQRRSASPSWCSSRSSSRRHRVRREPPAFKGQPAPVFALQRRSRSSGFARRLSRPHRRDEPLGFLVPAVPRRDAGFAAARRLRKIARNRRRRRQRRRIRPIVQARSRNRCKSAIRFGSTPTSDTAAAITRWDYRRP